MGNKTLIGIIVAAWLIIIAVALAGCQSTSRIEVPIPGDGTRIITGGAADDYVRGLVENEKTAKARINEMFGSLSKMFPALVLALVAGLAFWGFTRSRFGWVIPASAIGGMVFIVAFARYAELISIAVVVITLVVLVWKAVEYHKERDDNVDLG